MPFCRECGKEVQADWVTCPYCSQPIGPPASQLMSVQDSVVSGDVHITQNLGDKEIPCQSCGFLKPTRVISCVDVDCSYQGCFDCMWWVWKPEHILQEMEKIEDYKHRLNEIKDQIAMYSMINKAANLTHNLKEEQQMMKKLIDGKYEGGHNEFYDIAGPWIRGGSAEFGLREQQLYPGPYCTSCIRDGVQRILDSLPS